jgi:hypothetical protein
VKPSAPPVRVAIAVATPLPAPSRAPLPLVPLFSATLQRLVAVATFEAPVPPAVPRESGGDIVSWKAGQSTPARFTFTRSGCRLAVTIDVRNVQFIVAHQALVQPHRRGELLGITLQRRAASTSACAGVADVEPSDGAYEPIAMSYNGRHVTMRFAYAGDPNMSDIFPNDVSLDADVAGDGASATLQFFDEDWTGSVAVPLARTALVSVSNSW